MTNGRAIALGLTLMLGVVTPTPAPAQSSTPPDLTEASIEDLMNIRVTSVSRKEQKLSRAGAAVYVITQEDIHRSGATNIPDLLRMAPGVNVAQIDASTWAISVRGFNDLYTNKVLVLIDGRTVYSPDSSGVVWDQQDVLLEDIDHIEVIRGPGGTVWGANAVNGVINIITKTTKATQGGLITASAGSQETAEGSARYGGKIDRNGAYRVFGKYFNTGGATFPNGTGAADGRHLSHGGFRSDWDLSPQDTMTIQGDLFRGRASETITTVLSNALPLERTFHDKNAVSSGDLLGRWSHSLSNGSEFVLQAYYNRDDRTWLGLRDILNTVDVDFEHHLAAGSRHDIVWGAGYRLTKDSSTPGYAITILPLYPKDNLLSTFVQDEIRLTNSVWLTVGSKFEHNSYTGFEYEPSSQLVWTVTKRQAVWASAARAIRQPARVDDTVVVDFATLPTQGGGFALLKIMGNRNLKAEQLRDFETGYRAQISKQLSIDATVFVSSYSRLRTQEPGTPFFALEPVPHLVIPLLAGNQGHGRTNGAEVFANWNATHRWRLSPGYSFLRLNLKVNPSSQDKTVRGIDDSTPTHQFQLRSFLNVTRHVDWDSSLSYVGNLPDSGSGATPAYSRLDTRLGWRLGESIEISIAGQNLLAPRHAEFHDTYPAHATLIERRVLGKVTWRF